MSALVFAMPGNEALALALSGMEGVHPGVLRVRQFPDGETLVRVESDLTGHDAIIACTLDRPNNKLMPLYFAARTLRDRGAKRIWLVAPYLAYMRQDRQFQTGESLGARDFAAILSSFIDGIVTVDPHLHRIGSLAEIYSVPTRAVSASPALSLWLARQIKAPLLVGPDSESEQWVSKLALAANCPFVVVGKQRSGDRDVSVSLPALDRFRNLTPVLVDDIISTGRTMVAVASALMSAGLPRPVCVGIHAIFADDAYQALTAAGAARIATSNTVAHPSNEIDVHPSIAQGLAGLL